jgi:hypothetical protein
MPKTIADVVIVGLAIAAIWGMIALQRVGLRFYMGGWYFKIVPFSLLVALALQRIGAIQWIETLISNSHGTGH